MSKQILPVLADSFRYLLILLATPGEIFKAFLGFLKLNRKKTSHLPPPPPKKKKSNAEGLKSFSHDLTAAILVSQDNEMAAMLVSQISPLRVELFSYVNTFFCSNKFT